MKFRIGYDIISDLPHGFVLSVGRFIVNFHYDWPSLVWYDRYWHINEQGYLAGLPVPRKKPKRWLLRGIKWGAVDLRFRP
jgi:hypothetical protein